MPEKISSMHDDALLPEAMRDLGEYKDYPERFDPKERSVIGRIEQFGVDTSAVEDKYSKKIEQITWPEYQEIISEAIKARYDVIVASIFDKHIFSRDKGPDDKTKLNQMMQLVKKLEQMKVDHGINLIKRGTDFGESANVVMGLEAGAHLIKSLEDLKKLEAEGIKLFGLQYTQETPLASASGLSDLGKKSVHYMLDNDLMVDLAHSGYKTRQDVMNMAGDTDKGSLVSYTHGCTEQDIDAAWQNKMGERALKKEELEQLIKMGGIVGLGVTKPFFSSTRAIAERIDATSQTKGGVEGLAIGTDFGGVPPSFLNEIKGPDDLKKLADILAADFKMDEADINKILRTNAKDWLSGAIK